MHYIAIHAGNMLTCIQKIGVPILAGFIPFGAPFATCMSCLTYNILVLVQRVAIKWID